LYNFCVTAKDIIDKYIAFFEKRGHQRIANAPLVPENDPTTLFTSSGMQPLVPYLLGELHPQGKRLVNVQNCFRAQDIDEVGDNRHTTFFRMLGNWSLGEYFKEQQLPWFFEFLTNNKEGLGLDPKRLYVTVFEGDSKIPKDTESIEIWKEIFTKVGIAAKEDDRIRTYGVEKNWWSRAGIPQNMPAGEPGGPDSEVFYDFQTPHDPKFGKECHPNCDCGRFLEIGNSVFMQYQKQQDGSFKQLPTLNVDFGGGLERLLAAVENQQDIFQTSLFTSIIQIIEAATKKNYKQHAQAMRIVVDHLAAATFILASNIIPSNKEQGYILRRLIRRALDNFDQLGGKEVTPVIEAVVEQYQQTDPILVEKFEHIKGIILEETQNYKRTLTQAKQFISKKYVIGDKLDDAFELYTSHGLSPTQIKSLGYTFDDRKFADKMKEHQEISRKGATQKFAGGLADHSEQTIKGHTATHLLHQALRDVLGPAVFQTGSNITPERIRFDFSFDRKLTDEEIKKVEDIVNKKIGENLPVHFEMLPLEAAKKTGAIGLFDEKYGNTVKVYFIGGPSTLRQLADRSGRPHTQAYSVEFCGGPHVDFTSELKKFTIKKQESLGAGQRRIYAVVGQN